MPEDSILMPEDSILTSIKKSLNIAEDDTHFDTDVIININSAISILTQIGVGPAEGYSIVDKNNVWSELFTDKRLNLIKTYLYLKVKLVFDPPLSSAAIDAIKEIIAEDEWRIQEVLERALPTEVIVEGDVI